MRKRGFVFDRQLVEETLRRDTPAHYVGLLAAATH